MKTKEYAEWDTEKKKRPLVRHKKETDSGPFSSDQEVLFTPRGKKKEGHGAGDEAKV